MSCLTPALAKRLQKERKKKFKTFITLSLIASPISQALGYKPSFFPRKVGLGAGSGDITLLCFLLLAKNKAILPFFFFSSKTQSPCFSASVQRAKILALLPTACVGLLEPIQPPQALALATLSCPTRL